MLDVIKSRYGYPEDNLDTVVTNRLEAKYGRDRWTLDCTSIELAQSELAWHRRRVHDWEKHAQEWQKVYDQRLDANDKMCWIQEAICEREKCLRHADDHRAAAKGLVHIIINERAGEAWRSLDGE